jgi:hypothetical protein
VEAHKWFNLASASKDAQLAEQARTFRDDLAEHMTSQQIMQAQDLAKKWQTEKNIAANPAVAIKDSSTIYENILAVESK